MDEDIYIPQTLPAQFAAAYNPPRCFWHPTQRINAIDQHLKRHGLRLRWDRRRRALVIDANR